MRLKLQLLALSFSLATRTVFGAAIAPIANVERAITTPKQTGSSLPAPISTLAFAVITSSTRTQNDPPSPTLAKRTYVAVSILLEALPSTAAAALQSSWFEHTHHETRTKTTSTSTLSTSTSTSQSSTITTSTSSSTTSTSSQPSSVTAASTSPTNSSTTRSPQSRGLSDGAVAGIVVGSVLGAFLIVAGAIIILRRLLKHMESPGGLGRRFTRRSQNNSIFPESAWLYDPSPTPPRSPSLEQLQPTLHPGPQHRTPEVTMVSPSSALSQPYVMSSPENPRLTTTSDGDAWLNPFPDRYTRQDFAAPSWYGHGRPF